MNVDFSNEGPTEMFSVLTTTTWYSDALTPAIWFCLFRGMCYLAGKGIHTGTAPFLKKIHRKTKGPKVSKTKKAGTLFIEIKDLCEEYLVPIAAASFVDRMTPMVSVKSRYCRYVSVLQAC